MSGFLFPMTPLLFLLLLSQTSADVVKCNSRVSLTPRTVPQTQSSIKPTLDKVNSKYLCGTDTLIYTPSNYVQLKVEYTKVSCNPVTEQWEATENYKDDLDATKIIKEPGYLECKDGRTMSCEFTRFDFDDMSLDKANKAQDPKYERNTYRCEDPKHHLFLKRKFTIDHGYGHYLSASTVECKDRNLTVEFAHLREPQKTDYRDTITCKEFSCTDTLDPTLSYFNVLKMKTHCEQSLGDTCRTPDFYDDHFPCGQGGHELTFTSEKDIKKKVIWLKNHYVECQRKGEMAVTDFRGVKHIIEEGDTLLCRMPESCKPLMSAPNVKYGCNERYDCYNINGRDVPTDHLSVFDGHCFDGHILKIFPLSMNVTEESPDFLIELDHIFCQYGKWRGKLSSVSKSNAKLDLDVTKDHPINETTNLVCKRRVDFLECPPPPSKCSEETTEKSCRPVEVSSNGLSLTCPNDFNLMKYIKYTNGIEEVIPFPSELKCDRGFGRWITKDFPYSGLETDEEKESYAVCAKSVCTAAAAPISSCEHQNGCVKLAEDLKTIQYWNILRCDPFYVLKVIEGGIQTKAKIYDEYYCSKSEKWTVRVIGGGTPDSLTELDNVFCSLGERIGDGVNKKESGKNTKLCRPNILDSNCLENDFSCERVTKSDTKWTCPGNKNMWYIEDYKNAKFNSVIESLTCDDSSPFWRVKIAGVEHERVPLPRANFYCLSKDRTNPFGEKKSESEEEPKEKSTKKKREPKWHFPVVDTVIGVMSLLVIIGSAVMWVYTDKKRKKMLHEENNTLER